MDEERMTITIKSVSGADLYVVSTSSSVHAAVKEAVHNGADLRGADLRSASLYAADLRGADLRGAKGLSGSVAAQTSILPEGSLIGWKKACDGKIVKLKIPARAQRSNASGRKCRADRAKVLAIYDRDGIPTGDAFSTHDPNFRYEVGATVTPREPFDTDRWNECASGIHFFITRQEAESY